MNFSLLLNLIILISLCFCQDIITLTIEDEIINTTSEYYLSTTIDSAQLYNEHLSPLINDPNVPFLLSQLSPGIGKCSFSQHFISNVQFLKQKKKK